MNRTLQLLVAVFTLTGCGSLERKAALVNPGDGKAAVMRAMGEPGDRQFSGKHEVWQYCQTGAGFGYHDYRMVWFAEGKVTGITSYKDSTPASMCTGHFKPVRWEDAPDATLEIRNR